ncbi:hypothetical protein [Rhodococcus qingshengii]|uniref:hypothetical protein n=1 Tax=Rhodococcus qingshengii TaxID=334542 RepID=UPI001C217500|nr:hypothetical protein [Rhodococcus qingshengii]QXC40915.1 hypothetical protein KSE96_17385 [Rhodococcus qingshengii]
MKKPPSAATDDGQPNPKQRNLVQNTTSILLSRHPSVLHAVLDDLLYGAVTRDIMGGLPVDSSAELGAHRSSRSSCDEHSSATAGVSVGISAHTFGVLLECATGVERDLAESGYFIDACARYMVSTHIDEHGDLVSWVSAVIDHASGPVLINLEDPVVFDGVLSDRECPPSDLVRVTGQIVRLLRDAICFVSFTDGIHGRLVSSFRYFIRVLSELVSAASENQTQDPNNEPATAEHCSDDREGNLPAVQETSLSVDGCVDLTVGEPKSVGGSSVSSTEKVDDPRISARYDRPLNMIAISVDGEDDVYLPRDGAFTFSDEIAEALEVQAKLGGAA